MLAKLDLHVTSLQSRRGVAAAPHRV
jgi:hypothetical protein